MLFLIGRSAAAVAAPSQVAYDTSAVLSVRPRAVAVGRVDATMYEVTTLLPRQRSVQEVLMFCLILFYGRKYVLLLAPDLNNRQASVCR